MKNKLKTVEQMELDKKLERDKRQKRYLELARIHLRSMGEGKLNPDLDNQDRRVTSIIDASFYADKYMRALSGERVAYLNYRLNIRLGNKEQVQNAEIAMSSALEEKDLADESLRELLPRCPAGLIITVAEWRNILLLPKEYRDLIGMDISDDAREEVDVDDPSVIAKLAGV